MAFSWAKEPRDSFKSWLLPHLLAHIGFGPREDGALHEQLAQATDNWHNVELQVSINGIPVPGAGEELLSAMHDAYQHEVNACADEMIRNAFGEKLDGVQQALKDVEDHIYETLGIHRREW